MKIRRTDTFMLRPQALGEIYVYRASARFKDAWDRLNQVSPTKFLPLASLETALRCMAHDFVHLPAKSQFSAHSTFLVTRSRIDPVDLSRVLRAWENKALNTKQSQISHLVDELTETKIDLSELVNIKNDTLHISQTTPKWFWEVAHWKISHRLAQTPLQTDEGALALRLDAKANLYTWDRVMVSKNNKIAALHRIEPRVVTLPSHQSLGIKIGCSLVRLASDWPAAAGKREVYVDIGDGYPLLNARIGHRNTSNKWQAYWADKTIEVLASAELIELPDLSQPPTFTGALRCGFKRNPKFSAIGRGVGTHFREFVAHHSYHALSNLTSPILMKDSQNLETRKKHNRGSTLFSNSSKESPRLKICLVYSESITRQRFIEGIVSSIRWEAAAEEHEKLDALQAALQQAEDGQSIRFSNLEFSFLAPKHAENFLLEGVREDKAKDWCAQLAQKLRDKEATVGLLVETNRENIKKTIKEAPKDPNNPARQDPKDLIRKVCAGHGISTQFLDLDSRPKDSHKDNPEKTSDYPAKNAILDLFRSCGFFLHKFPATKIPSDTWFIGVYCVRATKNSSRRTPSSFYLSFVALRTGTTEALGYVQEKGWMPLSEATIQYIADYQPISKREVPSYIERALSSAFIAFPESKKVVMFDAQGCRNHLDFLKDTIDKDLPYWLTRNTEAVIRCRSAQAEIPQIIGDGEWEQADHKPATYTEIRNQRFIDGSERVSITVSGSATMSQGIYARSSTRFHASEPDQRRDWHSVNGTEHVILHAKSWSPNELHLQCAMLCRLAPHWDRVLRWPAPLHLARAIVRDCPGIQLDDVSSLEPDTEFK